MVRSKTMLFMWIGGGIALFLVIAVGALSLTGWGWSRDWLERNVGQSIHRKVTIREIDVHFGRYTAAHLGNVRIANAPWGSEPSMAEIDALDFKIDLLNLLRGRVVLPELRLARPKIVLEKNQEGAANWDFSENPQAAAATKAAAPQNRHQFPIVESLVVERGTLIYRDPKKGIDITSQINPAIGGNPVNQKVTLAGRGTLQGQPFNLRMEGGSLLSLRETEQPYPVKADLSVGKTKGHLEGTMRDPVRMEELDLRISVTGDDMAALFPVVGIPTPRTPPYEISGRLRRHGEDWAFDDFSGRVGASELSGNLSVGKTKKGDRSLMKANLISNNLDLRDLSGFVGGKRTEEEASRRVLPDQPIDLARLRAMDMDVNFVGKKIQGENMPLKSLNARLVLHDGLLAVDPLAFGLAQGNFSGRVDVDGRQTVPAVKLDLHLTNVDFAQFFQGTRFADQMKGTLDGRIELAGSGRSTAEVLGNGDGRMTLTMREGTVSALAVELAELDVANSLGLAVTKDKPIAVNCFVADLKVDQGKAQPNVFLFDTSTSMVTGNGSIDLGQETMDLKVEGHPKRPSLFSANAPIVATGTWRKPHLGVEPGKEVARGAAAVALGALLTPLAAIVPFLNLGTQRDPPCASLVQQAQQTEGAKP